MSFIPDYLFEGVPTPGDSWNVAPGVWWIRMPLPFKLNHINLWMLEDREGWTLVDTGILSDDTKVFWTQIEKKFVSSDRPIKRLICTHYHPDHMGLAAWLCDRHDIEMTTSREEWMSGHLHFHNLEESKAPQMLAFYKLAGFSEEQMRLVVPRAAQYTRVAGKPPQSFNRVKGGDVIEIDGNSWEVMIAEGHSVAQLCLFCAEKNILLSGDQVLPRITPNISLQPEEPEGDPLKLFLDSLEQFRRLPEDTLVFPSHDRPFRGLLERVNSLNSHHHERLRFILTVCVSPKSATEVLKEMFPRELDDHQIFFAIGEALAHLHYLMHTKKIKRTLSANGIYVFEAPELNDQAA